MINIKKGSHRHFIFKLLKTKQKSLNATEERGALHRLEQGRLLLT